MQLGLIIHLGKKHNLIAGYNTMDKDEKEAFDIITYARYFGLTFYIMGIGIMIFTIIMDKLKLISLYQMMIIVAIMLAGVGYLNLLGMRMRQNRKN